MKRLAILISLVGLSSLGLAPAVLAAPPSNDDVGSATIVGSLPYTDGPYDTTESTTGATDPGFCFNPAGAPDRSTVWYSFIPVASDSYRADTLGSDYDTTLYVGTPNGSGGIDVIACNDDAVGLQSVVQWDAVAGTTYLVMVGTCCGGGVVGEAGGGGQLEFHLDVAPPAPTVELTVDRSGTFTPSGTAIISGTITCTGDASFALIGIELSQRVGRFIVNGFGSAFLDECPTTATPWSISVSAQDASFRGGSAQVDASAFACGSVTCADDFVSQTVRLRGPVEGQVSPPVGPPPGCPPAHGPPDKGGPPVSPPVSPPVKGPPACPGPPQVSRSAGLAGIGLANAWLPQSAATLPVAGVLAAIVSMALVAGLVAAARVRQVRPVEEDANLTG